MAAPHAPHLIVQEAPRLTNATLLLALTGWMDGGLVSTGTVKRLMDNRPGIRQIARIDPDPFYLYNFPGSMEIAALFRPEAKLEGGVLQEPLEMPENVFHADPDANLAFFIGKEPNLKWQAFADALFDMAHAIGVTRIIFMGSFGGTVPHTREPRMYGSVSHEHLKPTLAEHGLRPSDYQGPASFSTLLLAQCPAHHIEMLNIVAEIPSYLQGINPLSIEAVSRRLARILNVPVDLDALRQASNAWEVQVSRAVEKDDKLAATVRKLEDRYDNELIGQPVEDDEDEEEEEAEDEE